MSSVVIDRAVLEQVQRYLQYQRAKHAPLIPCMVSQSHVDDIDRLLEPLDAVLSAPEPFERLDDGALVVGSGPTYYSVTTEDDDTFGKIIHVYEENRYGDTHECIGDTADEARAIAHALLALTEEPAS